MQNVFNRSLEALSRLPGIGPRSASRIAFYLMKNDKSLAESLSKAVLDLKKNLRFCRQCGGISEHDVCEICTNKERNPSLLCVVEEPGDIFVIEKTGVFSGYYHVLMGALSPLDGIGPEELRIQDLEQRMRENTQIEELFLATNPTLEGDATADYIHKLFQKITNLIITRISHGIPTGSAIEFAEPSALARSIRSRTAIAL